jgi:hypothetical protein
MLANWKLKALLGIDLNQNIECVGSLSDFEKTVADVASYDSLSIENNSTVKQLEIQERKLEADEW